MAGGDYTPRCVIGKVLDTDVSTRVGGNTGDFHVDDELGNEKLYSRINGKLHEVSFGSGGSADYPDIKNNDGNITVTGSETKNVEIDINLNNLASQILKIFKITTVNESASSVPSSTSNTTIYSYTVPYSGYYLVNGFTNFKGVPSTEGNRVTEITTTSDNDNVFKVALPASPTGMTCQGFSFTKILQAGDIIKYDVGQTSGAPMNIDIRISTTYIEYPINQEV